MFTGWMVALRQAQGEMVGWLHGLALDSHKQYNNITIQQYSHLPPLPLPADTEAAHFGGQGPAIHFQQVCGAFGAGDPPVGAFQGFDDVIALHLLERFKESVVFDFSFAFFGEAVIQVERISAAEDDGSFDDVFQFADVAREFVFHEPVYAGFGDVFYPLSKVFAVFLGEMLHQQGDIFAALAEGDIGNGKHVEPVE